MRRWDDGAISHKHGTRFWSEMISYWVYWDWNTIFIMKRNDWSTERMMDVNESWRTVTHFFAGYLANERIKDWYKMPSAVPQQCRHGLSSWKRWFLLERWESIFIMEVNKEMKGVEVTREGASSTFLLDISIQQEMNVCMEPFFPHWLTEPTYTIFITKVILISRETDDRWHLSREWRYRLFRWSFGYTDWIINATRHKSRKLISPLANRPPQLQ